MTARVVTALSHFGQVEPPRSYQLVLNDAAYHEIERLEHTPGADGDRHRRGRESESRWAPSPATVLSDRAAVVNNQL